MTSLKAVRFGLPALMIALGVALIVFGDDAAVGAGVVIIGSALLVSLANALVRFSVGEMQDRTRDQDARDFYGAHGRWPDDADPPSPQPDPESAPAQPPTRTPAPPPRGHPGVVSRPIVDREGRRRPPRPRRPPRRPRPGP